MRKILKCLAVFSVWSLLIVACDGRESPMVSQPEADPEIEWPQYTVIDDPLWIRHHDSSLKILSIGNSFTSNATEYLPYFFNILNDDSVCIATLTFPGCSLRRHWANHCDNLEVYTLVYSDSGEWLQSEVKTLDDAIALLDWDVITLQQDSGNSGDYATYQPHLENLRNLIRVINPKCKIVWHMTWSYTSDSLYKEFSRYDYDWEKMYDAILDAGSKASGYCDAIINSATLIKDMREAFPDIIDGFSSDGRHVDDATAQYALSKLWYESLVAPITGITCMDITDYPFGVNAELMHKTDSIISDCLENPVENGGNSVPMIRQ